MMTQLHIFTDGSVNTQSKVGYGARLVTSDPGKPLDSLKNTVTVRRFEQTSSTRLELQTLLWVLEETIGMNCGGETALRIYTDSQNIISLRERRARLEQSNYFSSKNKRLNNYVLYQDFYRLTARLDCEFVKVEGHQTSSTKVEIDKLFDLVDRASRRALRENS